MALKIATIPEANDLLEQDPFALLSGMLLDQQDRMEKAFTSPYVLARRMGVTSFDATQIADYDPDKFEALFREVPALHRFPAAMAKRVQELAKVIVAQYDGDTASIWLTARTGNELVSRIAGLPGFGEQKARIFTALLGKQFGVRPRAWRQAAGSYGDEGSYRSVADVVDSTSLIKVREFKKAMKAAAKAGA